MAREDLDVKLKIDNVYKEYTTRVLLRYSPVVGSKLKYLIIMSLEIKRRIENKILNINVIFTNLLL